MDAIGSYESLRRLRTSLTEASKELAKQRDDESRRVSHLHNAGVFASWLGMALIVGTIASVVLGETQTALLSLIANLVTNAVNTLFSKREDKAHERLRELCKRLEELEGDVHLVEIAGLHANDGDRDAALKKILDHILQRRAQR